MTSPLRFTGALLALFGTVLGCGAATGLNPSAFEPLRFGGDVAALETGIKGPRYVPESIALERTFGLEPGGGMRGIVAGVRVVSFASGAVLTADDRLAQPPSATVVLPERFGGGVLFALADTLWRAERWLARAEPVFRAPGLIRTVWVGLDRVYLKMPSGAVVAVHPVTGAPLDLGALPASPSITGFAALDGFRAVALADMRGVVATTDAGASWKTLPFSIEPKTLSVVGESLVVAGAGRESFEVRPEGDVTRFEPRAKTGEPAAERSGRTEGVDVAKTFGARPLAAAITDGVPMADGSVLVARDGALAKVRTVDGAIVDLARDAFPLRSSRCRGIALGARGQAGFVCGEPQGRTHVYAYSPARRGLDLVMAFDSPRVVLAGGSGAIAVRGPCREDVAHASPVPGVPATEVTYCIRDARGGHREQVLTAYVESARVIPLADGSLAVIAPPRGEVGNGHLTLASSSGAKTARITFEGESDAARRALTQGMWLEGFEERNGVLGGWIEHAGTMLGVEVRVDGRAKHGAFVRDAGTVFVSGRFGLGWTSAQRGYETVDGGMNWRAVELPEPVPAKPGANGSADGGNGRGVARGCGPAGCVLEGWIRVGYGDSSPPSGTPANSLGIMKASAVPTLDLTCDLVARGRAGAAPNVSATAMRTLRVPSRPLPLPRNVGEFTPFFAAPAPALHTEEVGTTFDVQELVDHARPGLLARAYVWGAKGLEWDATSRWVVRWTSPFTSSAEVFSSAAAKPPRAVVDAARFAAAAGSMRALSALTFGASDDPRSALLVVARAGAPPNAQALESYALVLDDGRAPIEVRRSDGEIFGRIDGAVRHEGRWFLLSEPDAGEPSAAVLWEVEAGVAREIARVPRVVEGNARAGTVRIAKREGEGLLGLIVDGYAQADRNSATRWVIGIDVANGRASELEPIGNTDFSGKALAPCVDDGGWTVDLPLTGQPIRASLQGKQVSLKAAYGRLRIDRDRACVDRLSAVYEGSAEDLARATGRAGANRTVEVGLLTGLSRQELRCGR